MNARTKTYFVSDLHLGIPDFEQSLEREKKFCRWLDAVKNDAKAIYIVGDIFDFWFEYRTVVPRGYVRLLGKLAELRDAGISIYVFQGNHDFWMFGYFEKNFGIPVYDNPKEIEISGKKFFVAHGDGLGNGDHGYKFIKKVFRNRFFQWCFSLIHPSIGMGIADFFSKKSRIENEKKDKVDLGEKEILYQWAKEQAMKNNSIDYFVLGHRHIPKMVSLNGKVSYINLGDWMNHFSYAVFDGEKMELKFFER